MSTFQVSFLSETMFKQNIYSGQKSIWAFLPHYNCYESHCIRYKLLNQVSTANKLYFFLKSQFSSGSHRCPIKVITGVVHHIIYEHVLLTLDKNCTNYTNIFFALILNIMLIILSFKSKLNQINATWCVFIKLQLWNAVAFILWFLCGLSVQILFGSLCLCIVALTMELKTAAFSEIGD